MKLQSPELRLLNDQERSVITSALEKGKIFDTDMAQKYINDLCVNYERMQGGFCICLIILELGADEFFVWRGASRLSYKDKPKRITGELRAFSRAVLYSHPVELS